MDYAHHLMLVYATYLIAVASPGPSNMAIMGVAMNHGRAAGVALSFGVLTGSMFWALLAAAGISSILSRYAEALVVIKVGGGLYLLFLAYKAARSAAKPTAPSTGVGSRRSLSSYYLRGALLHLTNPKSILGWIAIMSLGLKAGAPDHVLYAIIGGCAAIGCTVFVGYALLFSTEAMGRAYRKSRRWIEGTLAMVFGYAGIRLLLTKV
jgi:threonine efflux protein